MALILKQMTTSEFVSRFRAAYRDAQKERVILLARFILNRITAGDLTDTQVRTAFGLTSTQWNNLKTRMSNLVAASNSVNGAVGE